VRRTHGDQKTFPRFGILIRGDDVASALLRGSECRAAAVDHAFFGFRVNVIEPARARLQLMRTLRCVMEVFHAKTSVPVGSHARNRTQSHRARLFASFQILGMNEYV
jgi:hypothetical protein